MQVLPKIGITTDFYHSQHCILEKDPVVDIVFP